MHEVTINGTTYQVDDSRKIAPIKSPGQALTRHIQFYEWLTTSPVANDIFDIATQTQFVMPGWERNNHGRSSLAISQTICNAATTVYVSSEMTQMMLGMAQMIDAKDPPVLTISDLIEDFGVMLFEDGITYHDIDPVTAPTLFEEGKEDPLHDMYVIRGLIWCPFPRTGIVHTDSGRDVVFVAADEKNADASGTPVQEAAMHGGVLLYILYDSHMMLIGTDLSSVGGSPFIPSPPIVIPFTKHIYTQHTNAVLIRQLFTAIMRVCWQRIITPEPVRMDRAEWRRWKNSALGRRHEDDTVESAYFTHSVIVRSHWRDQWYPSLGPAYNDDGSWNPDSHRKVFIHPHIRGEGPLIMKHRVTEIVQ